MAVNTFTCISMKFSNW